MARQCRPSVVVVDLRAGAAQDARTIAALKGDASTKDIPVVATCSSALPPDVKADAFLSKPFGPEGLKSLLSRYIPRRRGEAKPKGLGVVAAAVGPQRGEDEVLRRLELEFLPRWNVRECFSVGELIAFSQDLLRLGEEGGVPPLVEWAEGLLQGASCFDLRLTEGKLERFPDLLEAVREKALEAKEQHG